MWLTAVVYKCHLGQGRSVGQVFQSHTDVQWIRKECLSQLCMQVYLCLLLALSVICVFCNSPVGFICIEHCFAVSSLYQAPFLLLLDSCLDVYNKFQRFRPLPLFTPTPFSAKHSFSASLPPTSMTLLCLCDSLSLNRVACLSMGGRYFTEAQVIYQ